MIKYFRLSIGVLMILGYVVSGVVAVKAQGKNYEKREFCAGDNWSYGNKESFKELRELKTSAANLLTVDGGRNGGIRIKGEDRSDILVRACVQAWAESAGEAQNRVKSIRVETGSTVRAVNDSDKSNWSVSYEILVPRSTNLKLSAENGGIGISGVNGNLDFETRNGGITLAEVGGNVRGRTNNGGVKVKLSGTRWNGGGLDLQTTNGGVNLELPQNYAARLEAATTNGGFKSDLPLNVKAGRWIGGSVNTDINGGGAPIRIITTNGGVRINSAN